MFIAFASLLAIVIGLLLMKKGFSNDPEKKRRFPPLISKFAPFLLVFFGIYGLISCSFLTVDSNEVGLMKRIYLASQLPPGKNYCCK